jgi:hypothetical protein
MSVFTLIYTRALDVIPSDDVNIPYPNVVSTGVVTSLATNKLVDSAADFITGGIQIGDTVFNQSVGVFAYVAGVENATTLLLSNDIMGTSDGYGIYQGNNQGCYIYVPYVNYSAGSKRLAVITLGGDEVVFDMPPSGVLPVQVLRVTTSTTIDNIIALW